MAVSILRHPRHTHNTMKLTALLGAFAITTATPLFAVTDVDIAPAELVGKVLFCQIVNGGAPYAKTGNFTCSFEALGNGIAFEDLTGGDTVPSTMTVTTYTASAADGSTQIEIPDFIAGQNDATLTLHVVDGEGRFEVSSADFPDVTLSGTFDFRIMEIGVVKAPEIDVKQGKTALKDGKSKVDFSTLPVTRRGKSRTKTFTITNSGDAPLKNLGFSVDGKNRKEFIVSAPKIGVIVPGGSVTIRVTFTPKVIGQRKADLHILSNDEDENPFDIRLRGNGGGKK